MTNPDRCRMARGTDVAVCYDGKLGRRVLGVVTEVRGNGYIKVRFVPYEADDKTEIESWFHKIPGSGDCFEGVVVYENALMPKLFPMLGATAQGDYYTVHKWNNPTSHQHSRK